MSEWPFEDPENVVSLTVRPILEGHQPILLVCHDADDGTWQFLTGGEFHMEDAMMVALRSMYRHDLSIGEVADLPLGWTATRTAVGQPWRRSQD